MEPRINLGQPGGLDAWRQEGCRQGFDRRVGPAYDQALREAASGRMRPRFVQV
jgi:hypothetical protein